jgi:hypothetical protein
MYVCMHVRTYVRTYVCMFVCMQLVTTQGQLANVLDTGSRPASFASLSSAGNVIKLGFTSTTNTTSAITRALASHTVFEPVSGFETVSDDAGDDQVQFSKLHRILCLLSLLSLFSRAGCGHRCRRFPHPPQTTQTCTLLLQVRPVPLPNGAGTVSMTGFLHTVPNENAI